MSDKFGPWHPFKNPPGFPLVASPPDGDAPLWQPMSTAPKDGTLILLLCESGGPGEQWYEANPTEDSRLWRTIGWNNLADEEVDEWRMAGWCWDHDHITDGNGTPVNWMPLPKGLED